MSIKWTGNVVCRRVRWMLDKILVWDLKKQFRRSRRKRENIYMDLTEVRCKEMDWFMKRQQWTVSCEQGSRINCALVCYAWFCNSNKSSVCTVRSSIRALIHLIRHKPTLLAAKLLLICANLHKNAFEICSECKAPWSGGGCVRNHRAQTDTERNSHPVLPRFRTKISCS
jgi:hypothetical protein